MTASYEKILKYYEKDLLENMDADVLRVDLSGKHVLDLDQNDALRNETSIVERNKMLLGYLKNDGSDAFKSFIEVLKSKNYSELARKLEAGIPHQPSSNEQSQQYARIEVPVCKKDKLLTEKQLLHLSYTVLVNDMHALAGALEIDRREVARITMDYPGNGETQMMKLLFQWHSKNGPRATLEELINCFNKAIKNTVNIDIDKVNCIIEQLE